MEASAKGKLKNVNAPSSSNSPGPSSMPAILQAFASPALWKTVAVGASGGFLGFALAEPIFASMLDNQREGVGRGVAITALHTMTIGLVFGVALLIWDNFSSLRGKWHRDLGPGSALFAFFALAAGVAAQIAFGVGLTLIASTQGDSGNFQTDNPPLILLMIVRGLAWTMFGSGIGSSIGILRGDKGQALRGALGGAIGGFIGGALFDPIAVLIHEQGTGVTSRLIGFTVWGAVAAGALRLVQETLRSAWLLGISTGPYEGKEYSLGKARLSVGRGNGCDLSLFRDESLAPQLGALVFQQGGWWWQGQPITINGVSQTNAQLFPGTRLQIGQTTFRFNDRSKSALRDPLPPPIIPGSSVMSTASPSVSTPVAPPTPTPVTAPPIPWTFAPSIGNSLTGFRLSPETGTATIGRASGNDWMLGDDGTSSRHARIDRTFEGLAITDLGSTNGTFINGQRLAPHIATSLRGGETIRIGRTQWMLRRGS